MNLRAFGLEADLAFGQVALSGADFGAVDLGDDGAVVFAGRFGGVPFADGLGDFVFELLIVFRFQLLTFEKIEKAVIGVGPLDFDTFRPDLVGALDMD